MCKSEKVPYFHILQIVGYFYILLLQEIAKLRTVQDLFIFEVEHFNKIIRGGQKLLLDHLVR